MKYLLAIALLLSTLTDAFVVPGSIAFPNSYSTSQYATPPNDQPEAELQDNLPKLTTSLVKSIVGSGALVLPAGVASMGDSPQVVYCAIPVIAAVGGMYAFFFGLIGRVCELTDSKGYREAWEKTVGPESGSWIALVVTLKTGLSCLAYSIILADSFQALAVTAGFNDVTRDQALQCVSLFILLPLCLQKDLTSLAPFSFLGLLGIGFTILAILVRYVDGSYDTLHQGTFLESVPLQPSFGTEGPGMQGVVLACTLATAFVAHYNAPRFYAELYEPTILRFDTVCKRAYSVSTVLFSIVAGAGFLTFGAASQGLILNNYSAYDPLITVSRASLAAAIALSYPLPFVGFRDGVLDLAGADSEQRTDTLETLVSTGLLLAITGMAAFVTDLAAVLSIGGATFSTVVASVFPTLMYRAAVEESKDPALRLNSNLALFFMTISVSIGITGVYTAINRYF